MLNYEEKKAIFDSYTELTSQGVSMGRLNYHFNESAVPKTLLIKHLHPKSGNAFIFAGYLPEEDTKEGYISVHESNEAELRRFVERGIEFLRLTKDGFPEGYEEKWFDDHQDELILRYTNEAWLIIMQSGGVEAVFRTKEQGEAYLNDEGFFN